MEKKVFWIDDAINNDIIFRFMNSIDESLFVDIGKSTYAQTQTDFQIKYYKDNFHINEKYKEIRVAIFRKIEELVGHEIPSPSVSRNCFLKYNEPGMRSAMHVEHKDVHGSLGFLFYLTTEDSGYVKWVDANGEKEYFKKHSAEKQKFVEDYHSYRQLYGNIEIQPKFNRLAVFETLGSHYVDTLIESKNDLPRLCIMGWPYCKL